ncbi:MAG TPA: FAD-dependent oxidoreductase [bacterium]|nr:FAD-dependent oxidoreductase [bacterium]
MTAPTSSSEPRRIAVVGAGIVGICCALYLQRDGHAVTVLDPAPPGEGGASFGNAGILAIDHCVPDSHPGMLWDVPRYLLNPLGPLTIRWRYLPRVAPWLLRLVRAGLPGPFEASSLALAALHRQAMAAFEPLLESAGAQALIRRNGWMTVYESSAAFAKARPYKVDLHLARGVRTEVLDGPAARELEPALSPAIRHAVLYPDTAHTTDPLRLVQALAADFQRHGGTILCERVRGFTLGPHGARAVHTDAATHTPDAVVLAAGAYSRPLARQLGSRVPLDTQRGYHATLPQPSVALRVPIMSGDFHCAMTPMDDALRVGGSAEIAGVDASPNYARVDALLAIARRTLPGLDDAGHTRWMGCRPSMPDSLPVLGRSPRYRDVYFAFGHGSAGLTEAAITGRLIAELLGNRPPSLDLAPYRPDRF